MNFSCTKQKQKLQIFINPRYQRFSYLAISMYVSIINFSIFYVVYVIIIIYFFLLYFHKFYREFYRVFLFFFIFVIKMCTHRIIVSKNRTQLQLLLIHTWQVCIYEESLLWLNWNLLCTVQINIHVHILLHTHMHTQRCRKQRKRKNLLLQWSFR